MKNLFLLLSILGMMLVYTGCEKEPIVSVPDGLEQIKNVKEDGEQPFYPIPGFNNPQPCEDYETDLLISNDLMDFWGNNATKVGKLTVTNDANWLYFNFQLDQSYIDLGFFLSEVEGMAFVFESQYDQNFYQHKRRVRQYVPNNATSYQVKIPRTGMHPKYSWASVDFHCGDILGVFGYAKICQNGYIQFANSLPNEKITMKVTQPSGWQSYFKTSISGLNSYVGDYTGWCVDIGRTINTNTNYQAMLYSSLETLPIGTIDKPQNLDLVNWIINNIKVGVKLFNENNVDLGTIKWQDIQLAIWMLMDNQDGSSLVGGESPARVNEIIRRANLYGEGFIPDCDDKIALVLVPDGNRQVTIIEYDMSLVPGNCVFTNQDCFDVWARGNSRFCVFTGFEPNRIWYWVTLGYTYCCN